MAQSAHPADVRALGRDVFLRRVVSELQDENARWPGLWSRLESLLVERDLLVRALLDVDALLNQRGPVDSVRLARLLVRDALDGVGS